MKRRDLIKQLQKQTAAYFTNRGYRVAKSRYILANRDNWRYNIILPEVANYVEEEKLSRENTSIAFPLHKWIHHGLSSQACLLNLLGDFVINKKYSTLEDIISLAEPPLALNGNIVSAELEYEDRSIFSEDRGQPTSVDLYLKTDRDEGAIIEFKFTESEFGTCSVYENGECDGSNPKGKLDSCYLHQLGRKYMKLMENHNLLNDTEYCPFTEFYQAYRLLLIALEHNGRFLLIHDERNPAFLTDVNGIERGRYIRFKQLLPKDKLDKLHILSIQRIVGYLQEEQKCSWLEEFKEKYL